MLGFVVYHFNRISTREVFPDSTNLLNNEQLTAQDLESDESDSEESDGSSEVSDIIPPPPPKPQKSNGTGPRPVVPDSDDEVLCLFVRICLADIGRFVSNFRFPWIVCESSVYVQHRQLSFELSHPEKPISSAMEKTHLFFC